MIYSQWVIVLGGGICLISFALFCGWRKTKSLEFWRRIKLYSALLGAVGIGMLLVNIDSSTRAVFTGKARDELLLNFIDTKAFIATKMAALCSAPTTETLHSRENTCWDVKNIDGQISIINVRDLKPFAPIKNWQSNPKLNELISGVNSRIAYMNGTMPREEDRFILLGDMARLSVMFWAAVLLVLAVSGSVGEAAFQYRDAIDRAQPPARDPEQEHETNEGSG